MTNASKLGDVDAKTQAKIRTFTTAPPASRVLPARAFTKKGEGWWSACVCRRGVQPKLVRRNDREGRVAGPRDPRLLLLLLLWKKNTLGVGKISRARGETNAARVS